MITINHAIDRFKLEIEYLREEREDFRIGSAEFKKRSSDIEYYENLIRHLNQSKEQYHKLEG